MQNPQTLENLTAGQAAKYCHLGDAIRRPCWDPGKVIVSPAYPHGSRGVALLIRDDLLAEDWQAIGTEHSV